MESPGEGGMGEGGPSLSFGGDKGTEGCPGEGGWQGEKAVGNQASKTATMKFWILLLTQGSALA